MITLCLFLLAQEQQFYLISTNKLPFYNKLTKSKKRSVLEAAAHLLKEKVMKLDPNKKEFSMLKDLSSEEEFMSFVPESLKNF